MAVSLNAWKGICMAVFTALSIIGVWVAVVMKNRAKHLFSAGVLLAGGLVHLLVDSGEHFEEHTEEVGETVVNTFQWAEAITGLTVVLLICLEFALERVIDNKLATKHEHSGGEDEEPVEEPAHNEDDFVDNRHANANKRGNMVKRISGIGYAGKAVEVDEHEHEHTIDADNPFGSLLLTIALSIHSIIEGLGIGEADTVESLRSGFIAVAFHKAFTAYALGTSLVSNGYWSNKNLRKYFYLSVFVFIFLSILGIAIGWAISAVDKSVVTVAVFIGITGGSFIYVAAMEILPNEARIIKRDGLPILPTTFCFVTGYVLMALLGVWA